jgi:hypothetical protein
LPEQRTAEQQNFEPQNFEGFFPSTFDIHYSIFDILLLNFPVRSNLPRKPQAAKLNSGFRLLACPYLFSSFKIHDSPHLFSFSGNVTIETSEAKEWLESQGEL